MRISILTIALLIGSLLGAQSPAIEEYGNNRLAVSPFMAYGSSSFNDVAVGLGYEHFFDSKTALQSDFAIGLQNDMLQLMIGPKFYPRGHDKPVSYGIAPVFLVSRAESGTDNFFHDELFLVGSKQRTHYQFGFMLINSVNMTLSETIYFGLEAGLGINYINRYRSIFTDGLSENDPSGNLLFRLSMGYRF